MVSWLNGKDWATWRKNVNGWWLFARSVLEMNEIIIGIEKSDETKVLIEMDDKLPDKSL